MTDPQKLYTIQREVLGWKGMKTLLIATNGKKN
jgi:hypothetical protein